MRRFAIAVAVVAGVAGLATAVAVRHVNALLAQWKPELEARGTALAGSPATIGALEARLLPEAEVVADELSIGGADGLAVGQIAARAHWSALLRGQMELLGVRIARPRLAFARDDGELVVVGVPEGARAIARTVDDVRHALRAHQALALLFGVALERIAIAEGRFGYRDPARQIDLVADDVALETGVSLGPRAIRLPNIHGSARLSGVPVAFDAHDVAVDVDAGVAEVPPVAIDAAGSALAVRGRYDGATDVVDAHADADALALAPWQPMLERLAPAAVAALHPSGALAPHLTVTRTGDEAPHLVGTIGLVQVAAVTVDGPVDQLSGAVAIDATPEAAQADAKDLSLRWRDVPARVGFDVAATTSAVTLRSLRFAALGGELTTTGGMPFASQRFAVDASGGGFNIAPALRALAPTAPQSLAGTVKGLTAHLEGPVADPLSDLAGTGRAELVDGRLVGTNVVRQVFRTLDGLPMVGAAVRDALPPEVTGMLDGNDTVVSAMTATWAIAGQVLRLTDVTLANAVCTMAGSGTVSFASDVDFHGTFRLTEAVGHQLARRARELGPWIDQLERTGVPVRITGRPDKLNVRADLGALAVPSVPPEIIDRAGDLLRNLLNGRRR